MKSYTVGFHRKNPGIGRYRELIKIYHLTRETVCPVDTWEILIPVDHGERVSRGLYDILDEEAGDLAVPYSHEAKI